jgi:hypothetical protein
MHGGDTKTRGDVTIASRQLFPFHFLGSSFATRRVYFRLFGAAIAAVTTLAGYDGVSGALARSMIDIPSKITASGINSMIAPSASALMVASGYIPR